MSYLRHSTHGNRTMSRGRLTAGRSRFRSRSSSRGCHEEDHTLCRAPDADLPRRCLVIKRTHPEEGIERTELRLVTYQRAGREVDQARVLMDAACYLQERADDAECARVRRPGGRCSRPPSFDQSYSTSGTGKDSTYEQSRTSKCHHIADQEKLRETLENLVRYFARRADESDEPQWCMITGVAERLLLDVTDCIRKERPLNSDLLSRIKELNKLAKNATVHSSNGCSRASAVGCVWL